MMRNEEQDHAVDKKKKEARVIMAKKVECVTALGF